MTAKQTAKSQKPDPKQASRTSKPDQKTDLTVGQVLKRRREQLGRSLTEVELATKIRGKFLVWLEDSDYKHLTNDIYTHGFVRTYATYLGMDAAKLVKSYIGERGKPDQKKHTNPSQRTVQTKGIVLTPKLVLAGVTLMMLGMVGAYLAWQFTVLAAAPRLELVAPPNDQVIYGSLVDINGSVAGGADVFVNGSPILTDGNGNFRDKLALQEGVNVVNVSARNKLGKTTTITRNVLAHLPKVGEGVTDFPKEKFDGVAVLVTIDDQATRLIVEVDGREAFNATMLPDTSRTFKGSGQIKITTFNAGATSLKITNQNVANQPLGSMGSEGEIKRDQLYSKDQQF